MKSSGISALTRITIGAAAMAALASAAVLMSPQEAQAGGFPCICPFNYDPVVCDGGATYGNQCIANCFEATGCERVGPPTW